MGKGEKFIFLDNLATLLIYNEEDSLAEFIHFIINKMRINNITGVLLGVKEEMDPKFLNRIKSFCDKIIELK